MCDFRTMFLCFLLALCVAFAAGAVGGLETPPPGCRWERSLRHEAVSVTLKCDVKTAAGIGPLLDKLTNAQIDKIDALQLSCTDSEEVSSLQVDAEDPRRLNLLKDLRIENCRVRYVPSTVLSPLRDLTDLTVRSNNNARMEFHSESFQGLRELRRLDLGANNIWTLPSGVFCPLFTLNYLNLTDNRLQDLSDVGFSDWGKGPTEKGTSCNTGLKLLNVSFNDVRALMDNGLSSLRTLEVLDLRSNGLSKVGDRAFVGLAALGVLYLADNKLDDLPPELFQSTRKIRQIFLSNNTLKSLAPGVLQGLDNLQILDLSRNRLTHSYVNRDTFDGLVALELLNLSYNDLARLDPRLFLDLKKLKYLYLDNNAIETLNDGVFAELKDLRVLSLSRNRLRTVEQYHFSCLYAVNELYLDENQIVSIHPRSFENVTNLHTLVLAGNYLKGIPDSIRKLRFLKYLDIGKNGINNLASSSFEGLEELSGLRIVDNNIVNISKDAFVSLPSLEILNLASNKIENIEGGAFDSNRILKVIKLDGNRLRNVDGVFLKLSALAWLNLSGNKISNFDYGNFPENLEWLNMQKNSITKIDNVLKITSTKIRILDLSFNGIREIDSSSVPDNIEELYLNNNAITNVMPYTFLTNHKLRKVVLYANQIRTLDMAAFNLSVIPENRDIPEFYIGENPLLCDCNMKWVKKINQWNPVGNYPLIKDLDSLTCQLVHGNGGTKLLLELPESQFLCKYESRCTSPCLCCDYERCDCKMTCPDRCTCYRDSNWNSNVINCSNAGYTKVPEKIPMNATEIYLDGNNFESLGNHVFIGKTKLAVLYLNNSNIASMENGTFNGLYSLKTLHLGNNRISELKGHELSPTKHLKELYLDHNAITYVDNNTFAAMTSLKTLHLEHNKIRDLNPNHFSSALPSLVNVYVEGNVWSCDCDSIYEIEKWVKTTKDDAKNMFCDGDANLTIYDVITKCYQERQSNIVPSVNQPFAIKEVNNPINYVPILSIVLIAIILICLLGALIFSFRQDVRLWAHSKYGLRLFKNNSFNDCEMDKDRMYDAYMVYSVLDDDFVSRGLSPELEQSGYSMCLHYRDLQISSENYLSETLINATEASKRLILVVSFSFLQNEWSKPSFKRSVKTTIESINPSVRRHKVVFILTTDVSALNLDADLQSFFKNCTVIFWGEKRFWEKIRFAMPDIENLQWNKSPSKSSNQLVPNARRNVSRYTASPTSLDQWYKYAALPPQPIPVIVPMPGDDSSLLTNTTLASQQYGEDPLNHSYVSIDTHCYERSRRDGRMHLDEQGYLRPRPAPPHHPV